jgi:hypothetical protein
MLSIHVIVKMKGNNNGALLRSIYQRFRDKVLWKIIHKRTGTATHVAYLLIAGFLEKATANKKPKKVVSVSSMRERVSPAGSSSIFFFMQRKLGLANSIGFS